MLSIPYRILQGWLAWYHQAGVAEVLLRTPGGGPGKPVLFTATQHEQLRAEVDTVSFHSAKEVATFSAGMDGFDAIAVNQTDDGPIG